jgi:serine/threonine-protein kinase
MGTVYEALDPQINRKVALKTMIQGLADNPELRARFLREAQSAGGLRHRNIVTVYDLGEDKGQPFIAMEFIEGIDLEKLIANREPLSTEWKLDVIRQVCEGLGFAHRAGIVHRDIKPANIRVTPDGEVKIMDFGIAHLQSSTMTKSGLVLGTVHYMAPEQIVGQKVDHRADIFSVGAIAYELVSGKKPFDGESITGVMYKIMHERPDPAALPKTEYSPGLEGIVMKALSRELHERYQSLDEMHADLVRLVRQMATRIQQADPALPLIAGARDERASGHIVQALKLAREALRVAPGHAEAAALVAEFEKEERQLRAVRLVEEARRLLTESEPTKALEIANEALAIVRGDPGAKAVARQAEADILGKRVEREMLEIRAEMERARAEGQLQKASTLSKRLLELNPDDADLVQASAEIEATIHDREVEQLCGLALAYAADGDTELAQKITQKIERLAPKNPRYLQLRSYLEEEGARRAAEALTSSARDHLALGNLAEARAAAEEALKLYPSQAAAREIFERVSTVMASQERAASARDAKAAKAPAPSPAPAPASDADQPTVVLAVAETAPAQTPATPPERPEARPETKRAAPAAATATATPPPSPSPTMLTPLPEGAPSNAEAAALVESARALLRERQFQKALAPLEQAAALEPGHAGIERLLGQARIDARKAEIESLTTAALNHFVQNNYPKARKAVDKALTLDPQNKKAKELLKILGSLK